MGKILLKKVRLVEGGVVDIEVIQDKITRITDNIPIENHKVIDGNSELYVSKGWIDLHTHCFDKYQLYGDSIDEVGYKQGVTTILDAGTAGADTIGELYWQSKNAKTNVYAFINVAKQGIATQDELSDLKNLDEEKLLKAIQKYRNFIVGLKVRMSQSVLKNTGNEPLEFAKKIKHQFEIPMMIHIGSAPAELEDVMKLAERGDIITHIFNPKVNGILYPDGKIKSYVVDAHLRGVYFDVGHGSESFSFEVCEKAKQQGIEMDSISSDIYRKNRLNGPVYSLVVTMNKMLTCGYSLKQVIDAVTLNPAKIIQHQSLGVLKVGNDSNLTLFRFSNRKLQMMDSKGEVRTNSSTIEPVGVVLNGEYITLGGMYDDDL